MSISLTFCRWVTCCAGCVVFFSSLASADNSEGSNTDKPIAVTFGTDIAENLHASVVLGEFEIGEKREIHLSLRASGVDSIKYDSVQTSCGCVAAVEEAGTVVLNSDEVFKVKLDISQHPSSLNSGGFIRGMLNGTPQFHLVFRYSIKGAILLPTEVSSFEFPKGAKELQFEIPFKSSGDITEDLILTKWSGNIEKHIKSSIELDKKKFVFTLDLNGLSFPLSASFTVTSGANPYEVIIPVLFSEQKPVAVYPSALRLVELPDDADNYHSTLLVSDRAHDLSEVASSLYVEATLGDRHVRVKSEMLKPGAWRVALTIPKELLDQALEKNSGKNEPALQLICDIKCGHNALISRHRVLWTE